MKKLLSKNILKQSIKNNWKLWAALTGVLCFFITVITFTLTRAGERAGSGTGGPMSGMRISLLTVYGQMFFGTMGLMLMLIYAIAAGNKLVASEVDKGTMSFTLNTPTTRKQIIFSKALYYITSIITMAVLMGAFATFSCMAAGVELVTETVNPLTGAVVQTTNMDYGTLWMLILGFVLFGLATSGICFAASCWFNRSGQSLLVGAGLPVAFWLFNSLSGLEDLEFLKYFSLNTLFDTTAITSGTGFIAQFIAMGVIAVVLYAVGITKFLKKDLPL